MSVLFIADLHLSDNPRDLYRDHFMRDLPNLLDKYKVHDLIVLGDLTEEKDRHSATLTNMVVHHMVACAKECRVHILKGNHDYVDEEQPFFEFLHHFPTIDYHSTISEQQIRTIGRCLFLPHTHNHQRDWKGIDFDRYQYVFAHQTFHDADIGHGRIASDGIPLIAFKNGPVIISGDVHIPQRIQNLYYVGAPYTIDFGDDYQGRLLLHDADKLTSINIHTPQKKLVVITEMKDFKERIVQAGDVIKVRVDDDVFDSLPECSDYVRKWAEDNGCILHAFQMYHADILIADERESIVQNRPDDEILSDFAKQRGLNDQTLKTGQRILRKT